MPSDDNEAEGTTLAMGQVRSLLWAARHLQDLLNVVAKVPNPDPVQAIGCFFSAILLRAFAAEVALKGLCSKVTGNEVSRTHDLSVLFRQLPDPTRHAIDRRFQRIRRGAQGYSGQTSTVDEVLADHNADFVHWRYVLLEEQSDERQIDLLDLEPAVEAILEEYAQGDAA